MQDFLADYVDNTALTMKNVRQAVDDYSLISYYLGQELELNTRYSSPLREGDENPSFSLFYGYGKGSSDKLYFKDHVRGSGDVYDFLKEYLGADTMHSLLQQINYDLGLELEGVKNPGLVPTVIKKTPVIKERPKLAFVLQEPTKEFMNYWWDKYEITRKYTDFYKAHCVRDIHYKYSDKTTIVVPRNLCIGYTIGNYHKSYQPFEKKEYKFRNDYPSNYVEGHIQLDWSRNDLLVITKAHKECILFRKHWDIQAVSGKSETTMIHPHIMQMYLSHFKRVVLWLDPDEAGLLFTQKYLSLYPSLEIACVPSEITQKDPTDIFEVHRYKVTTEVVKQSIKVI